MTDVQIAALINGALAFLCAATAFLIARGRAHFILHRRLWNLIPTIAIMTLYIFAVAFITVAYVGLH